MKPEKRSTTFSASSEENQRNTILRDLAADPWLEKTISNICKRSGLNQDLRAELFLILGEKPSRYLIQAEEGKYLRFMIVRILQTMHNSPRHPFFIQYRYKDPRILRISESDQEAGDPFCWDIMAGEYDPDQDLEYQSKEEALAQAESEADQVSLIIWRKYQSTGSAKEVATIFGVPYSYIRRKLAEFRSDVNRKYLNPKI